MQISNEMRAMISRRRPGYSLEAPFYQNKEIFKLDVQAIFGLQQNLMQSLAVGNPHVIVQPR